MKPNASKIDTIIVARSRTLLPRHPALSIGGVVLEESSSLQVLGVTLDSKLTFETHVRNIVSVASQKLGIVRKAFKIFGDVVVTSRCFKSFVLPLLEYCSPVWGSAAESHLKLLDRVVTGAQFVCGDCGLGHLAHRRAVGSLCMLYKIVHNLKHPLHDYLPEPHIPVRVTRRTAAMHNYTFSVVRHRTVQFSRCFLQAAVVSWNSLSPVVFVDGTSQGFKSRANQFLRGVFLVGG